MFVFLQGIKNKMISERIKIERKRLNLSQTEFGEACGVGLRSQQNYENGSRNPDADYLQKAHELGVDVNYLMTGSPASESVGDDEKLLLESFRSLDEPTKEIALRVFLGGVMGLRGHAVVNNGVISNSFNGK